jgi:transposase
VLDLWLSGSSDLNPIENLWTIMKDIVIELNPTTVDDFINDIISVWNNISQRFDAIPLKNSTDDKLRSF